MIKLCVWYADLSCRASPWKLLFILSMLLYASLLIWKESTGLIIFWVSQTHFRPVMSNYSRPHSSDHRLHFKIHSLSSLIEVKGAILWPEIVQGICLVTILTSRFTAKSSTRIRATQTIIPKAHAIQKIRRFQQSIAKNHQNTAKTKARSLSSPLWNKTLRLTWTKNSINLATILSVRLVITPQISKKVQLNSKQIISSQRL